jgi:hypothetical protein
MVKDITLTPSLVNDLGCSDLLGEYAVIQDREVICVLPYGHHCMPAGLSSTDKNHWLELGNSPNPPKFVLCGRGNVYLYLYLAFNDEAHALATLTTLEILRNG